jgi:hypothetical protein
MRVRKQSMRQITDAAAIDRASGIVSEVGDVALEKIRRDKSPTLPTHRPVYFRGALVKPK